MASFLGLPKSDRRSIAEGIVAWGNLVFAALVLGQSDFLGRKVDLTVLFAGIIFWLIAYIFAIIVLKGGD